MEFRKIDFQNLDPKTPVIMKEWTRISSTNTYGESYIMLYFIKYDPIHDEVTLLIDHDQLELITIERTEAQAFCYYLEDYMEYLEQEKTKTIYIQGIQPWITRRPVMGQDLRAVVTYICRMDRLFSPVKEIKVTKV